MALAAASLPVLFLGRLELRIAGPFNVLPIENADVRAEVDGIAIGFGSNFLNAVYAEKRLILNNGSHRAYTLRKMGFTHVPCIVQHISSREELDFVACSDIRRAPDLFLKHPRPSMLRDYFNPSLYKVMPSHRRLRQITVRFKVEDNSVPAL